MPTVAGESAALSRELADFLIELSIALHKNAIYPAGHPLLDATVGGVERRLGALLQERPTLALGVARHQLVIEGVATDAKHPLLRELASRLHGHHLGAVRFAQGVTRAEIADFLRTVAEDAGRSAQPLGLQTSDELARWKHVRLFPLTYEQLELLEEKDAPARELTAEEQATAQSGAARAAQLWIGLARAALATDSSGPKGGQGASDKEIPPEANDPVAVARAIDEHGRDKAYDQVVVGYLLQIADELKVRRGKEAAALQRRISRLVSELQPETLRRLLDMGGDMRQRRRFVLDAAQGMAVDAVVDLVQAAADTSQQTISHSMLRLLGKFAVHAQEGAGAARPEFDSALREQVQSLLTEWQLSDPNPDQYRRALEAMVRAAPVFDTQVRVYPLESERMLHMALETGAVGDALWRAVDDLVSRARFSALLDVIDRAPPSPAVAQVLARIATPDRIRELTLADTLDLPLLERMCRVLGLPAADPLLDAVESDRHVRAVAELLPTLGPDAAELAVRRLDGARWSMQRTILGILARFDQPPAQWDALRFLATHPDAEVRRETLRLLLKDAARRDAAITLALADGDERVLRTALAAAAASCPRAAVPTLMRRVEDQTLTDELRVAAVRVLGGTRSPELREWLLARVATRSGVLRRVRLAPKSAERLAALQALASGVWAADEGAAAVLELARRSADPEIRAAATPRRAKRATPRAASYTPPATATTDA